MTETMSKIPAARRSSIVQEGARQKSSFSALRPGRLASRPAELLHWASPLPTSIAFPITLWLDATHSMRWDFLDGGKDGQH